MNIDTIPKITPADLVAEYVALRDQKQQFEKNVAAKTKELYSDRMDEIERTLLDFLNDIKSDSIASPAGTAYKKLSASVTIADAREFSRHVIGSEEWDLLDWRANKTRVQELVKAGGEVPPGINFSTRFTIGIRRK